MQLTSQSSTVAELLLTCRKPRRLKAMAMATALYGNPARFVLETHFGAFFSSDMPYKVREAEKTTLFPADRTEVMISALTMSGRTAIPKWFMEIT